MRRWCLRTPASAHVFVLVSSRWVHGPVYLLLQNLTSITLNRWTCWATVLAPVGASISRCELTNPICLPVFVFVPPLLALLGPNVRYPQGQRADGSWWQWHSQRC
jgi:hypothetical protein